MALLSMIVDLVVAKGEGSVVVTSVLSRLFVGVCISFQEKQSQILITAARYNGIVNGLLDHQEIDSFSIRKLWCFVPSFKK